MSAKQLKLIAVGLAILLLLWGGSELLSRGSDMVTGALHLPTLAEADVDAIMMAQGTDSIALTRQSPAAWSVNGHRAAPAGVHDLLQALGDSVRPELVAQDASSFARLHVDSTGGRWLRLGRGGKPVLELIVGAHGNEPQSTYLRRPGDPHVYLWRGRLGSVVERSVDDWRDKRIVVLEPDSIAALDVARGTDRYTLKRAGKTWILPGGAADSAAVARYLERLKAINATGFASSTDVAAGRAARPQRRLTVRGGRGVVLVSLAFDSSATGFVVRHVAGAGGEGATVYRMSFWEVDGVTPASRSLVPAKK